MPVLRHSGEKLVSCEAHGTVEVPPKELRDLSAFAVIFDRSGPETFTETLVSAMMQHTPAAGDLQKKRD